MDNVSLGLREYIPHVLGDCHGGINIVYVGGCTSR
jgi:hypothetical protein